MRPTISDVHPVTDGQLDEIGKRLGVFVPPRLRAIIRVVNGGSPTPRDVPCKVYSGETHVPVYEFVRWDDPSGYVELCRTHYDDLSVPRRYLVLATADADTFYVDSADPGLRVMYFQCVEGDYVSTFGDGDMDLVNLTLEGFMGGFIHPPQARSMYCPNPACKSSRGWDGFACRFCGTRADPGTS